MFKNKLVRNFVLTAMTIAPFAAQAQENITIEQYAQTQRDQRDQKIVAIAEEYAGLYPAAVAQQIKAYFNVKVGNHSAGVNLINQAILAAGEHQNIHDASVNTIIADYIVGEYGMPNQPRLIAANQPGQ